MRADTLTVLRCPYCGGRLELVTSSFHRRDGDAIRDGILACHCCVFPVVAGIPVMHLEAAAVAARELVEAGNPEGAARKMFGLDDEQAERFERAAASPAATYRDLVDALGPSFEGGYFLYRFSDPTFLVADAVVRSVARVVVNGAAEGRTIDVCGGSGHLTRSLSAESPRPVIADLYFAKLWLARRFTAPDCEPVCCDGNAPLPFAKRSFDVVVCSDAFHYIWTKRQLASEMMRVARDAGAVVVTHAHNADQWNPSAGMPLPPDAYRELFEEMNARVFAERQLLADVVRGGPLDLARRDDLATLDADPALTIVASRRAEVFRAHRLPPPLPEARGEFRLNPLYAVDADGDRIRLRLRFPSDDYAEEYGAARAYLAEDVAIEPAALAALPAERLPAALADLARRWVVLDLPRNYY